MMVIIIIIIIIVIIIMEDGARIPLVMSLITNILSCFAKADREPNKLPTANPNTFSTANNTLWGQIFYLEDQLR